MQWIVASKPVQKKGDLTLKQADFMEKLRHDEAHKIKSYTERVHAWKTKTSSEQLGCYAILTCVIAYCVCFVFLESTDALENESRSLSDGWSIIGKRKDIADFEWTFWVSDLREVVIKALISHVFIGILSRFVFPEAQRLLQSAFCVYCIWKLLGYQFVIIVALQCASTAAVGYLTKNKWFCWFAAILQLILLHYDVTYTQVLTPRSLSSDSHLVEVAYGAIAFAVLRTTGYSLEVINTNVGPLKIAYDVISYNFYLPFFLFGPVMTFDAFKTKKSQLNVHELLHVFKEVASTAICVAAIDFMLHFLHVTSIPLDLDATIEYPGLILTFLMFCNVMLDWTKAWALYSIASGIASHVDGYQGAPNAPKCMANLYTFADTYFDRGIHHWACRYIYDPIGFDHSKVTLEALAGGLTFAFVALWQGGGTTVLVWAFANWFGLSMEFAAIKWAEQKRLTDKYTCILFGTVNYFLILLFNCVAIIGLQATTNFAKKLLLEDTVGCTASLFVISCYVSIIYHHREMDRTNAKKLL